MAQPRANTACKHIVTRYNEGTTVHQRVIMKTSATDKEESGAEHGALRSGDAARLAGVPVETLRVWERRYGIAATQRSASGQRLYSASQVRRLGLIKQLVDLGHNVGMLAHLPQDSLQQLLAPPEAVSAPLLPRPLRLALVGTTLPMRMSSDLRGTASMPACDVVRVCDSLAEAPQALLGARADIIMLEIAELGDEALPLIRAASLAGAARAIVVLYHFGASATIARLRAEDCLLAREPAAPADILRMCAGALAGTSPASAPLATPLPPVPPCRFDAQALAAITAATPTVACECPRHLAEILLMVGSFERYSLHCATRHPDDALLHAELAHATGQARAMLETAMDRLARAEGLPLPADAHE